MSEYNLNSPNDVVSVSMKEELETLRKQHFELLELLDEYGISYKEARIVSDVEWICRKEIDRIKHLSERQGLDDTEVDNLEKLTKILNRELSKNSKTGTKIPKGKKLTTERLIELLNKDE